MTTIEEHKETIKEYIDDINEKIRADLLLERQKIIGFSASEAAVNLFALFLHKRNLVEPGFNVNHRYFGSLRMAENTFHFEFPNKQRIISFLIEQENLRNKLCYGKAKDKKTVESAIANLFNLKDLLDKMDDEI